MELIGISQFRDFEGFHNTYSPLIATKICSSTQMSNLFCAKIFSEHTTLGKHSCVCIDFRSNDRHGQASEATETMLIDAKVC